MGVGVFVNFFLKGGGGIGSFLGFFLASFVVHFIKIEVSFFLIPSLHVFLPISKYP